MLAVKSHVVDGSKLAAEVGKGDSPVTGIENVAVLATDSLGRKLMLSVCTGLIADMDGRSVLG